MTEFLRDYGFFFLVAILMLCCHVSHGGHGRREPEDRGDKGTGDSGHQH
jgi:hypothetical protein